MKKFREKQGLPSYEAERKAQKQASDRLLAKTKELNRLLEKELAEAKEDAEILKNPCTSLTPTASAAAFGHPRQARTGKIMQA